MAPPKKTAIKMDLNSFLNDETFNDSWSTDEVDLNNINIPIQNMAVSNTISLSDLAHSNAKMSGRGASGKLDPALRREREEYPIPDYPPYKAIINNIPWDISEFGIQQWVEDGLNKPGSVVEVMAPREHDSDRLKGMAFVTLNERSELEKMLTFNGTKLNDRTVYISVAAPRKDYGGGRSNFDDIDWSGARGSNFRESRDSRDGGAEPDWSAARGSNFRESREAAPEPDWSSARGSNFRESRTREPREAGPEPDWSGARGSNFRESREAAPEPDWSSARGSNFRESKPREPKGPEPDWSSARGSNFKESRSREPRAAEPDWSGARGSNFRESKPREQRGPEIDWSSARGSKFGQAPAAPRSHPRKETTTHQTQEETPKVVSSAFAVLSTEDEDEEEQEQQPKEQTTDEVEQVQKATAELSIDQDDNEEWETVGKK